MTSTDLDGVAELLARGFPARPLGYWAAGLARLAHRQVPEGYPRFGYMLELGGRPVGVLLTIAQEIRHSGDAHVRCNLASWYVEPAFRSHAAMLGMVPFRLKGATLLNISAAPNTWPVIEAQGFVRYAMGQRLALPLLGLPRPGRSVALFDPVRDAAMPDAGLLADHQGAGCLCLVGTAPDRKAPFVFLPLKAREGRLSLPGVQLVYVRAVEDIRDFAFPLGVRLAARGLPFVLYDAPREVSVPPGLFFPDRARRYARGKHPPAVGDLAYTEFTIFGP